MSPSVRGRGLKSIAVKIIGQLINVALRARAWIEILRRNCVYVDSRVALRARAWIEIPSW